MKNISLDGGSIKILNALQENCRLSLSDLAAKIGMSTTPCWRRHKELESSEVIVRYAAVLDRFKVGLSVCCLAHVSMAKHGAKSLEKFEEAMRLHPQVVECYETTGTSDFILKVIVPDMDAYHHFLRNVLSQQDGISQVSTSVVLNEVKNESALFLGGV
jgi:Lrp/AsnC family transcriptional regulator, leucine-responsive regulatory protein